MPSRSKRIAKKRDLPRERHRTPDKDRKRINIFISYATEDRDLVNSIYNLLNETFTFAPLFIYRDVEIKQGKDYAEAIDRALDEADVLLVVFTERLKMSHSYTGYEVGYFNRSKLHHPIGGLALRGSISHFASAPTFPTPARSSAPTAFASSC